MRRQLEPIPPIYAVGIMSWCAKWTARLWDTTGGRDDEDDDDDWCNIFDIELPRSDAEEIRAGLRQLNWLIVSRLPATAARAELARRGSNWEAYLSEVLAQPIDPDEPETVYCDADELNDLHDDLQLLCGALVARQRKKRAAAARVKGGARVKRGARS